jgi:adenylate kinase
MRLLLTGTPGCGKTVLSEKLAIFLKAKLVDVNGIIDKNKIYRLNAKKEKEVDLKKLSKILKGVLVKEKNVVIESHLLCEMPLPCDRIIVLRCNPLVLKKRLEKRGYALWKVKENVLAELLDYCIVRTEENYAKGKIVQVDFTKPLPPKSVLGRKKAVNVDWMPLFYRLGKELNGFSD